MLKYRKAVDTDSMLYFNWANDPIVREQSYSSGIIDYEEHEQWFKSKLKDDLCLLLIFQNQNMEDVGQIRIQKVSNVEAVIGISVASEHRGKGYASTMLMNASEYFLESNPSFLINAYIKIDNLGSKRSFENAGFKFKEIIKYENWDSYHYVKI